LSDALTFVIIALTYEFVIISIIGIDYLNFFNNLFMFQINHKSSGLMPTLVASYIDGCEDNSNEFELMSHGRDFELCNRMGAGAFYLKRRLKLP